MRQVKEIKVSTARFPASNRSLPDIGLLDPGAGIAGGFQPMGEEARR